MFSLEPGIGQQGAIPWQTHQGAGGDVVYSGKPMGAAPRSQAIAPKTRKKARV